MLVFSFCQGLKLHLLARKIKLKKKKKTTNLPARLAYGKAVADGQPSNL